MNPSASGWINKFGVLVKKNKLLFSNSDAFYTFLRATGFIYGVNVTTFHTIKTHHALTEEECAKTNLMAAFYNIYNFETGKKDFKSFIESLLTFYKSFDTHNTSFFGKLFAKKKTAVQLEKYIHSQVSIGHNIIAKNFSKLLVNVLLFADVLAYRVFLGHPAETISYFKKLEYTILQITYYVLNSKSKTVKYHEQFLKLLKASLRYQEEEILSEPGYHKLIAEVVHPLEKKYILDIAAMAIWEDKIIDKEEKAFMQKLGNDLELSPETTESAITHLCIFYEQYKTHLPHVNNGHFFKNFYDNASKMVSNLIIRNKRRLQKELLESKELVLLLSKATSQELSKAEKRKVKTQLTDIFKAIPSLAIFALPGGAVLLPLFVKLIPKLLPSSFDDNRID